MIAPLTFQPGPLDAAGGWRSHSHQLRFTVDGDCFLRLEFAAGHGPCPDLAVEVDGTHRGFFHPSVRREDRATVYRHGPIAGDVTLDVPLPALAPGDHVATITTTLDRLAATGVPVPDDAGGRHREQFGHHFGSGITWHGITLVPGVPDAPPPRLVATPLYVEREGALHELLELTVTVPPDTPWPARATVRMEGTDHELDLARPDRDFGHVRVRFPVPAPTGSTVARVTVDGGHPIETAVEPARKWTLHLVPHVHLDVGYTDVQGKVLELHSRNLDRALDALTALDRDGDFAFSVDGALIVGEYLATRSGKRAELLMAALRDGRISVNAFHSLFLTGVASLEEVYRAAYLAARLRDEHGVPVTYANLTDVPSYSSAVPSMLRALGVDAFVGIENHHRGGNADSDAQHLASPVQWEGVDGSRVLAHFSDTYSQLRFMAGDPQTIAGGAHAFCRLLARYDRPDYLPHDLAVIGTHADNEDLADGDAGFAARWNAVYAYPRLAVSTMAGYLDVVRPLADRLPVWRGDGGSYWEDGVGTGATVTAEHRRAQAALPAAEGLAALVARAEPAYRPHRAALDAAWEGALFGCEHTWTWAHANAHPHGEQVGDQLDWKRSRVHAAYRTAVDETRRALSQLGELVTTGGPTLLVHNPLAWPRDIEVEVEAPAGTSYPVPTEVLADCAGLHRFRLTVPGVPPFGYRALPVGGGHTLAPGEEEGRGAGKIRSEERSDEGGSRQLPATHSERGERGQQGRGTAAAGSDEGWRPVPARLTTDRWSLSLDPETGAVHGLTHRESGRELLDGVTPLGQVLYVLNGPITLTRGDSHEHPAEPRTSLLGRLPGAEPPDLTVHPATMRPVGLRRTYDGWRLRTTGSAPSLPRVEVEVLLRDGTDRVDVLVRLDKERVLAKESVYVAFPFAAADPVFRYDRQQGWIDPTRDHAPGACQEWFTTQYGVAVSSGPDGPATAWTSADAPLFTAGDIVRGTWPTEFRPASGTVFSWVLNNYWPTNTPPEQDGSLLLRYAFTPLAAFDPVAAGRFGREVRAPVAVSEVTRLDKFDTGARPLPGTAASLVDLDLPSWVHATVAEPRTGEGLLVRLQDLAGRGGTVRLRHPATLCRADEHPLAELQADVDGRVPVDLAAWQVVTLILH